MLAERHKQTIFWLVAILTLLLGSCVAIHAQPVPPIPPADTNRLYFSATAFNGAGESEYSNEVSISQTNLKSSLSVTLAWNAVTNAMGYRLYQGDEPRSYTNHVMLEGGSVTSGVVVITLPPIPPRIVVFSMTNGLIFAQTNPATPVILVRPNWNKISSTRWPVWMEGFNPRVPGPWSRLTGYYTNKVQPTKANTVIKVERL